MPNHILIRDRRNNPICACGYRPAILDHAGPAIVGVQWKAKTEVLDHVDAANKAKGTSPVRRSPDAPFRGRHAARYPRAGVRQTEDGRWLLTLWDHDENTNVIDLEDRIHDDRNTAFEQGWLTVGACWESGTNLNGWPAA
jgi:hypothetical protein